MAKAYYQPNGCSVGDCMEVTITCKAGADGIQAPRAVIVSFHRSFMAGIRLVEEFAYP